MTNNLPKNILATLIYYDLLDYPLTSFEIWKYLLSCNMEHGTHNKENEEIFLLGDIIKELENKELKKLIEEYRGFYFLKGRKDLVRQRLERNKISVRKLKLIRKIVWVLRLAPFVRMIAVTGRVAMKNAQAKSDLDLLVVIKHGHIFTGRTLVTLLVHLLGRRRYKNKIIDRICLNYFVTTKSLEIALKDLFSSSEYSFIFPLFNFKLFKKFQKNNSWIGKFRENYYLDKLASLSLVRDTHVSKVIRKTGERILKWKIIENKLRDWETERIVRDPRTHQDGSIILADDEMLVFLPEPQGPEISRRFEKRMEKIG